MKTVKLIFPLALMTLCLSTKAFAGPTVPEVSPTDGLAALGLIAGSLVMFRARLKR